MQKFVHHQYEFKSILPLKEDPRFHPALKQHQREFVSELLSLINKDEANEYKFTLRGLSSIFGLSYETVRQWINKLEYLEIIETYSKKEPTKTFSRRRKCYMRKK